MTITPKGNFVLARFVKLGTITNSPILMPDNKTGLTGQDILQLTIVAVGPGKYLPNGTLVPINAEPGDEVLLFAGRVSPIGPPFLFEDIEDHCMFEGDSIMAVIKRERPVGSPKIVTAAFKPGHEQKHRQLVDA